MSSTKTLVSTMYRFLRLCLGFWMSRSWCLVFGGGGGGVQTVETGCTAEIFSM